MASKPTLEQMSDLQLAETLVRVEAEIGALQTRLTTLAVARAVPLIKISERDQADTQMRNIDSEYAVLTSQAKQIRAIQASRIRIL